MYVSELDPSVCDIRATGKASCKLEVNLLVQGLNIQDLAKEQQQ
jgi:hypothetical protein